MASPSIDDLLAAIKAVAELQEDVTALQDTVEQHAKVIEHLARGLHMLGDRLAKLEGRKSK